MTLPNLDSNDNDINGCRSRQAASPKFVSVSVTFACRGRGHGQPQRISEPCGVNAANRTVSGALGDAVKPVDFGPSCGAVENGVEGDKALVRLQRGHDLGVFGPNRSMENTNQTRRGGGQGVRGSGEQLVRSIVFSGI